MLLSLGFMMQACQGIRLLVLERSVGARGCVPQFKHGDICNDIVIVFVRMRNMQACQTIVSLLLEHESSLVTLLCAMISRMMI